MTEAWVVIGPKGLYWLGLCEDEDDAWRVALGWPDAADVAHAKATGWSAVRAEVRWPGKAALVALTQDQVSQIEQAAGYDAASPKECADFINGIRHAEAAHGIKGE